MRRIRRKIFVAVLVGLLLLPATGFTQDVETDPAPTKFTILNVRRVPSVDPDRIEKYDYMVTYEVPPIQRYLIRIPEEEFSEERMIEAIREEIALGSGFIGKEYEME